jgi:hypothetical protein
MSLFFALLLLPVDVVQSIKTEVRRPHLLTSTMLLDVCMRCWRVEGNEMKFAIFGGADCPDALLSQLSIVAAMPAAAQWQAVLDYALDALTRPVAVGAAADGDDETVDDARDRFLGSEAFAAVDPFDAAQAACAMHHLLLNVARYAVPHETALQELSMLGLERAVAEAMVAGLTARDAAVKAALAAAVPMLPGVTGATATVWRRSDTDAAEVHLTLPRSRGTAPAVTVALSGERMRALLAELVTARDTLRA